MMPSRTNLATGIPSSKVKYSRLASTDDGYIDLQFKKSPPKIPYKAIALATVLFLIGAFLIIIGSLLLAGYISKGILFSDNKMLLPLSLNKLLSDPMRGQTGLFLS
ncbi:transmembrane protein 230 isoform X4 [Bubalus bubalis]|uniref:transmembrane protein 230 isoform X4 n=1 Tax=Bubalus bubalis TaxID=89462 RepID=UPI001D0FFE73|nr:transmembrane protein 230 isoform X4 [Bubalus bubalis]